MPTLLDTDVVSELMRKSPAPVQSDNGARIEEVVQKASAAIDEVAQVLAQRDRRQQESRWGIG